MNQGYVIAGRAQPLAHYPHLRLAGNYVFVSGLSARRPDGSVPEGIAAQTEGVLENLRACMQHVGLDLGSVVDLTVFLTDMDNYGAFNEVYNRYFQAETGPTRTTVGVASLPGPRLLIEVKAVGYVGA